MIEILWMRLRARGNALIRRGSGLTLNQLHASDRDTQFLGNKLRLRGVEPLPHLAFAGERRDACRRHAMASQPSTSLEGLPTSVATAWPKTSAGASAKLTMSAPEPFKSARRPPNPNPRSQIPGGSHTVLPSA